MCQVEQPRQGAARAPKPLVIGTGYGNGHRIAPVPTVYEKVRVPYFRRSISAQEVTPQVSRSENETSELSTCTDCAGIASDGASSVLSEPWLNAFAGTDIPIASAPANSIAPRRRLSFCSIWSA